jgi:hypothetical protein
MKNMIWALLAVLTISAPLSGQLKYEAEERISPKEIPKSMLEFIEECCEDERIKWYKEDQFNTFSYEAKFRKYGRLYSVEFNKSGFIEDVEIQIRQDEIPEAVMDKLNHYLDKTFDKFRIEKVQKQYTGATDALEDLLEEDEVEEELSLKYEMVIIAKKAKDVGRWELLFGDKGEWIEQSKIIFRNQDNLNY